jgi:hypothetical protein
MSTLDSMRDGTHWRERAREARATAELCPRPEEKEAMLDIATGYDRLAERAEGRLRENPQIRVVG